MKRYSIIHDLEERTCLVCGAVGNTHIHEVFYGTANRKLSIKYGLCVNLCTRHHNEPPQGVHHNKTLDKKLKSFGQKKAMEHYGWTVDEFRKIFGKNHLD